MPRLLYIVRHAKAEDFAPFQRDHDRTLVPEGIMAAARMGRHCYQQHITADRLISSSAERAIHTARIMAEQLHIDPETIVLNPDLFDGGPRAYLAAVNSLPTDCQSVMIFGHNPDVSYFAEFLTHEPVSNMSKGAIAAVQFDDLGWMDVSGRTGKLLFYITPKQVPH